jgi:tripeptide aminopeptidase
MPTKTARRPASTKRNAAARPAASSNTASSNAAAGPPEPDLAEALDLVMELMAIPGKSGEEGRVVECIRRKLRKAGYGEAVITTDKAHLRSPLRGEVGNLICKLPGTLRGPRRLLMAHLDTVPLCVGCKPVKKGDFVQSADKTTGLGADDRAGAAAVLTAALTIARRKLPHPPLTFFWPVQEEVGLHGAQYVDIARLGKPQLTFNWDGGPAEKVTIGATGAFRLHIEIDGLASHAGVAPEMGVSAIAIAGLAIGRLQTEGWLGDVRKGDRRGTSNIGYVHGGGATNVVTNHIELRAEARSHDRQFRAELLAAIENAFIQAAAEVRNAVGAHGQARLTSRLDYESFVLNANEPCVVAAETAIRAIGAQPMRAISNGGLDANWLSARGIPTVTMGCGQMDVHTVSERLDIAAFHRACRVALRLATATEGVPM